MEYPKYVSHKVVSAARVEAVEKGSDLSLHVHLRDGFDTVVLAHSQHCGKPLPEPGAYLVRYEDGYISFSPAKAFEEGYSLYEPAAVEQAHEEPVEEEPVQAGPVQD